MTIIRCNDCYKGFVSVGERKYFFEITESSVEQLHELDVQLDWRLNNLLGPDLKNFKENNKFLPAIEFYNEFSEFVKTRIKSQVKTDTWFLNPLKACVLVKNIKEDIKNLGNYIKKLDLENRSIEIEIFDCRTRSHNVILKWTQNYPREPLKIINHYLPTLKIESLEHNIDMENMYSISDFYEKFTELVDIFQEFWDNMALIDSQCWVLDPENPTLKDTRRRIKITDSLSIMLTFNPCIGKQRPNITILGFQSDVCHYKSIMYKNLEDDKWDCDEDLLYNLSNIFEVTIPSKSFCVEAGSNLVQVEECSICFTWRLDDEIPNEICETSTCKSIYHSKCLFTYFSSIPRNKHYFGKIQGECPNCGDIMPCTVPKNK